MASKRNMTKWAMMAAAALVLGLVFGTAVSSVTVQAEKYTLSYAGMGTVWEKVDMSEYTSANELPDGTYIIVHETSSGDSYAVQASELSDYNTYGRQVYALDRESISIEDDETLLISEENSVSTWTFTKNESDSTWTIQSGNAYLSIPDTDNEKDNAVIQQDNVGLSTTSSNISLKLSNGKIHIYNLTDEKYHTDKSEEELSELIFDDDKTEIFAIELNWYGAFFGGWHTPSWSRKTQFSDENGEMVLYRQVTTITYDLNLPDYSENTSGHYWTEGTPYISKIEDSTSYTQKLYSSVSDYKENVMCVSNLDKSGKNVYVVTNQNNIRAFLHSENKTFGKELKFDGWNLLGDNNEVIGTFTTDASIEFNASTQTWTISEGDKTVTIKGNVTLQGKWTLVSDVIAFHIETSARILDEDGNDIQQQDTGQFAGAVVLGHVYYTTDEGYEFGIADSSYNYKNTDATIDSYIFNPVDSYFNEDGELIVPSSDKKCYIVLEYVASGIWGEKNQPSYIDEYKNYLKVMYQSDYDWESTSNIKQCYTYQEVGESSTVEDVEKQILEFLAEYSGEILKGSGSTESYISIKINDSTLYLTADQVESAEPFWYVLKQSNDYMHCDGIIAVKTSEIQVEKTVYGLDSETVEKLMLGENLKGEEGDDAQLTIPVYLASDKEFTTLTALSSDGDESSDALYTYGGMDFSTEPYKEAWTLTVVDGWNYYINEENQNVSGYICNTLVVLTHEDGSIEPYLISAEEANCWTGGDITRIDIYNLYSEDGWGFFVLKTDENGDALADAAFKLVSENGEVVQEGVSDENGVIYFNNLMTGSTYTLTETDAPDGYALSEEEYTVLETSIISIVNELKVSEEPTTPTEDPTPEESETPTEDTASEETSDTVETETAAETATTETVEPVTATATSAAETGDSAPLGICICVAAVCEFTLLILIFLQMRKKKKEE